MLATLIKSRERVYFRLNSKYLNDNRWVTSQYSNPTTVIHVNQLLSPTIALVRALINPFKVVPSQS